MVIVAPTLRREHSYAGAPVNSGRSTRGDEGVMKGFLIFLALQWWRHARGDWSWKAAGSHLQTGIEKCVSWSMCAIQSLPPPTIIYIVSNSFCGTMSIMAVDLDHQTQRPWQTPGRNRLLHPSFISSHLFPSQEDEHRGVAEALGLACNLKPDEPQAGEWSDPSSWWVWTSQWWPGMPI